VNRKVQQLGRFEIAEDTFVGAAMARPYSMRSSSIGTQPIPPSESAILMFGNRVGTAAYSQSAHGDGVDRLRFRSRRQKSGRTSVPMTNPRAG
jgi:hypothetical protein